MQTFDRTRKKKESQGRPVSVIVKVNNSKLPYYAKQPDKVNCDLVKNDVTNN